MDPRSLHKLLNLFFFLPLYLPGFHSQTGQNNSQLCGLPFQCGNGPYMTYPFWNAARLGNSICGHPSFGLDCPAAPNPPILNISQLPYRVLDVDFLKNTLKVARRDLWNDMCSPIPVDMVFSDHFVLPPDSGYRIVDLYYNCSTGSSKRGLPNQFNCSSSAGTNFFRVRNVSRVDFACSKQISVWVNKVAALALETPAALSAGALRHALADGIWILWIDHDVNCSECVGLGGACTSDRNSRFLCDWQTQKRPNPRGKQPGERPWILNSPPPSQEVNYRPDDQKRTIYGVVFGAIAFDVAFVLVSLCWKAGYFPRGAANTNDTNVEKFLLNHGSLAPKRYKYSEIKKLTRSFSDRLGQGGYGTVYSGRLPNGCPAAVKVLFETDSNHEEFINEVASISRTSHVNIVSLLGFCYERKKRALVYEFMPNKSLDQFMRDGNATLDTERLYDIAVGVAKGLEYLHRGCNTRIIHFDIKPQNILLDENFCPKISDFGLAKLCKKKQSILSMLGTRGTVGYIAPEVFFRNFGGVSHKSDVYSYGIMILEMAGARKFAEAETVQSSENYFPDKIYEQVVYDDGMQIKSNSESLTEREDERARKMFLVGFWCIQTMPSDRPSMSKVVEMLEGSLESIQIPSKPTLFNPKLLKQAFSPSLSVHVEIDGLSDDESVSMETRLVDSGEEEV